MRSKKETFLAGFVLSIVFVALLVGVVLPAPVAEAGLPSRDKPVPSPPKDSSEDGDGEAVSLGAYIELQVTGAPAGAWSVVQWQDSAGDWQDVAGWQGSLPENRRWWVHEKDFGDGSFRWVVTQSQGGPVLGSSQVFNLPGRANETAWVTVSVAE